jgi:hypothetical protein
MSKVYSFRLSENNPREIQAREVMKALISQGYPLRYILTEALIWYGNQSDYPEDIEKILDQLVAIIGELEKGKAQINNGNSDNNPTLPNIFIDSVKRAAKQGVRAG